MTTRIDLALELLGLPTVAAPPNSGANEGHIASAVRGVFGYRVAPHQPSADRGGE